MLVSYEWLKDYVEIDLSPEELAEKLTMTGIEVESVRQLDPGLKGVVVGKVLSVNKHPEADKLYVVQVDVKDEILDIVVGIANYETGDLVPVAKPGAVLPNGMKIKKTKLRGVNSNGMLCSSEELGLELCHEYGILVLDEVHPVGQEIADALGLRDWVLELGLTPNRSDCLGLIGLAYEVSAITGAPLKLDFPEVKEDEEDIVEMAQVRIIDEELCPRYSAKIIKNIKIQPSPLWYQRRLLSVGIRPINNIVDVTNYVMWESGQPLHAFDYDRVKDSTVIIRRAYKDEKLITLDEQERCLEEDMLVIADPSGAVALAGVMGGLSTEITEKTRDVLLESANFEPTTIRKTSRDLGLRSEASLRFERWVDPNGTVDAANRAAQLLARLANGQVVKGTLDEYPVVKGKTSVHFRPDKARKIIGLNLADSEMKSIFNKLGLSVSEVNDNNFKVQIPTRRPDITREEDLVEEVARIYGYEHIETTLPRGTITQGRKTREQKLVDMTKELLIACGLYEVITYSFVSSRILNDLKLEVNDYLRNVVNIYNPISEEQSVMRTTLLGNLLNVLKYNVNRNIYSQRIFELGNVFLPGEKSSANSLPEERETLTMALMGIWEEKNWQQKQNPVDFYYLKGIIEALLGRLGIVDYKFYPVKYPSFHPARAAEIFIGEEKVGILGEVHADVASRFDLQERVYMAELNFKTLSRHAKMLINFKPLPRFPAVLRDIAVMVKEDVLSHDISREIFNAGGELVENVTLFDMYQGEQISTGYRSLAYSIVYRSKQKTLTDEEVNEVHQRIIKSLEEEFGAGLRE